jgi:hypothetical protein
MNCAGRSGAANYPFTSISVPENRKEGNGQKRKSVAGSSENMMNNAAINEKQLHSH